MIVRICSKCPLSGARLGGGGERVVVVVEEEEDDDKGKLGGEGKD